MPRNPDLNEQMRFESRRKILSTAVTLFAQKGFFNVRIADIANQAGMSPGNIYWYFPSKEELLKAILADFFDAYESILIQANDTPGSARQKLQNLVALQMDLARQYNGYFNVYMSILGHGGDQFMKSLGFDTVEIGMRYHAHFTRVIEMSITEGILPPQDPFLLAVYFFSFFNGLLITYGNDWQRLPPEAVTQASLRLLGIQDEARLDEKKKD